MRGENSDRRACYINFLPRIRVIVYEPGRLLLMLCLQRSSSLVTKRIPEHKNKRISSKKRGRDCTPEENEEGRLMNRDTIFRRLQYVAPPKSVETRVLNVIDCLVLVLLEGFKKRNISEN